MKKKKAIRNYVLISLFVVIVALLSFIQFPVPFTNYNFKGLANLHMGLELGGGVKNTYECEVADWYDGSKNDAYNEAITRIQSLLNKKYADAKVYLNGEDTITIEVPDTYIDDNLTVGYLEIKSEEGENAAVELDGNDIAKAEYMVNGSTHGVYIEFTKEGKKKFTDLTTKLASAESKIMYMYMNKDYENPISKTEISEPNTLGWTFVSGGNIDNKESGEAYADKLLSSKIGVNMKSDLDVIEIVSSTGKIARIVMTVASCALVVAAIVVAYVMFKQLGLVSMLSILFSLAVSIVLAACFDLQITIVGWIGFMLGFVLNYVLHVYYLNVIKKEYAMGKKFIVSFTSGYKKALFNTLDMLLLTIGAVLLMLIAPSNLLRVFVFNFLMTIPGTAFTSLWLNKVVAVNYTAFNTRNEKKVNFVREVEVDETK
jgi:preprotein translocase subunit SecD